MTTDTGTGDTPAVYTMSELAVNLARIIAEIEASGKPAFITRKGRFIAIIQPLKPGGVESRVLPVMARELGHDH